MIQNYMPKKKNRISLNCRKVIYPDKQAALTASSRISKRKRIPVLRAYYCDKCSCWHLTSMSVSFYNKYIKNDSKRP